MILNDEFCEFDDFDDQKRMNEVATAVFPAKDEEASKQVVKIINLFNQEEISGPYRSYFDCESGECMLKILQYIYTRKKPVSSYARFGFWRC